MTKRSLRVLVVDDHPEIAEAVARMVSHHVDQVRSAYDAASALEQAAVFLPELVIADLAMPDMDGLEMAAQLRKLPGLASAYFLALSAMDPATYRSATEIAGFDEHLLKPVTEQQLLNILDRVTGRIARTA